ncbi:MAG: DUF4340 domain-containing protein [Clostridia bacterium]|nr:DUF4340 domain-containing protein [Clostridia bacterium]
MDRQVKNMIVWISTLVVLILSLIVLIQLPVEKVGSNAQKKVTAQLTLNDYAAGDIVKIKVKNQYDEYEVSANNADCSIEKLSGLPTSQSKFTALLADCAGVAATEIIDSDAADLSIFGLVSPKVVTEVTYLDGATLNLYIGNDAPSGSGVYVCQAGQSKVYLFSNAKVDTFFYTTNDFIYEYVTEPLENGQTQPTLEKLVLGGTSRDGEITVTKGEDGKYTVSNKDITNLALDDKILDYATELIGYKSSEVVKYNPSNEDLEKYGLYTPYSKIQAQYEDRSFTLMISKEDKDNNIYVIKEGLPVIYKVTLDTTDVINAQYDDIADKTIIGQELSGIKELTLNFDNKDYKFELTFDESGNLKSVISDGKEISVGDFTIFYSNLKAMKKQEFTKEEKSTEQALLVCKLVYTDQEKSADIITFYPSENSEKALIDINESCNSVEYMTYIAKIKEDCKNLLDGKAVVSLAEQEATQQSASSASSLIE